MPKNAKVVLTETNNKSIHVICYIITMKEKIHMTTSADTQKVIDKIQQPFMIKSFRKLEKEGNSLNIIQCGYEEPWANIKHHGEKPSFPLRSGQDKDDAFTSAIHHCTESSSQRN